MSMSNFKNPKEVEDWYAEMTARNRKQLRDAQDLYDFNLLRYAKIKKQALIDLKRKATS